MGSLAYKSDETSEGQIRPKVSGALAPTRINTGMQKPRNDAQQEVATKLAEGLHKVEMCVGVEVEPLSRAYVAGCRDLACIAEHPRKARLLKTYLRIRPEIEAFRRRAVALFDVVTLRSAMDYQAVTQQDDNWSLFSMENVRRAEVPPRRFFQQFDHLNRSKTAQNDAARSASTGISVVPERLEFASPYIGKAADIQDPLHTDYDLRRVLSDELAEARKAMLRLVHLLSWMQMEPAAWFEASRQFHPMVYVAAKGYWVPCGSGARYTTEAPDVFSDP